MNLKEIINTILFEEEGSLNGKDNPKINVYNNEGTKPHLHYEFKNGTKGCIRLDIPRYFCHESFHDGLNSWQRKTIIDFLNNNWKKCVDIWNNGRTEYLCQSEQMPNYNLLPKLQPNGKLASEDRI